MVYIDIEKALDPSSDREDAIIGVPEDRVIRENFGKDVVLDLSSPEQEYKKLMFPVSQVFDWDDWQDGFNESWSDPSNKAVRETFKVFKKSVLECFKSCYVPVITLDSATSKEAVCVVFEKVNTGGKALDAFELITATFAASGYELRKSWYGPDGKSGRHGRLRACLTLGGKPDGVLSGVSNIDFLQVISLFHTRDLRRASEDAGKQGKELPAVSCSRPTLLSLPLETYTAYEEKAEKGFVRAAKFLHMLHIYRLFDLPYHRRWFR